MTNTADWGKYLPLGFGFNLGLQGNVSLPFSQQVLSLRLSVTTMDLQKAKILLEKINALYKNLSADARNISTIEKDLMRSYIQQLYEVFLELPVSTQAPEAPPVEIIKSSPKLTLRKQEPAPPPPAQPEPAPRKVEARPAAPAPEPDPVPAPAPVIERKPEPVEPPPVQRSEPPPPPKVQPVTPPPAPSPAPPLPFIDEELEELFSFTTARELSEKLSELPITDIKKAMGLNERIFTVNELFGGDQATFDNIVATLNQLRSYQEAKDYLIRHVAGKYHWASKDKKSKAKTFIKLIRRRFN